MSSPGSRNFSRRHLLAAGGALAATTTMGTLGVAHASAAPRVDADVIVVGSGLAGLVATSELAAAG
ncbi:MAG: FAD-binding dehydrogenase, partial [Umezawaea sp.]